MTIEIVNGCLLDAFDKGEVDSIAHCCNMQGGGGSMSKEIFVFGSNLAGRHGKGAALDARKKHGAVYGVGVGLTGNSYAIPTKGHDLEVLPLLEIARHVTDFKKFAADNSQYTFKITRVGCGLAGYTDEQISPLFKGCPSNCTLPEEWGYM